jgi:tetratricopeptide (TPR) repeat protein
MLLDGKGQFAAALPYYNQALEVDPNFTKARCFRAVLFARLGRFREAGDEIQKCLDKEPSSGATRYAAACIAALTTPADRREAGRAFVFLQQAFRLGYGRDKATNDADLENIRDYPEFRRLIGTTKEEK